MLELLINAENERELACLLPNANADGLTDADLEEAGAIMTRDALDAMRDGGIDYHVAGTGQRRGAFVIVQSAGDGEEEAWDAAIEVSMAKADALLAKRAGL